MHPPPNGSLTILGFSEVFLEQTILAVHERARRETKSCLFSLPRGHRRLLFIALMLENTAEMAWNLNNGFQHVSSRVACGGLPDRI